MHNIRLSITYPRYILNSNHRILWNLAVCCYCLCLPWAWTFTTLSIVLLLHIYPKYSQSGAWLRNIFCKIRQMSLDLVRSDELNNVAETQLADVLVLWRTRLWLNYSGSVTGQILSVPFCCFFTMRVCTKGFRIICCEPTIFSDAETPAPFETRELCTGRCSAWRTTF